MKMSITTIQTMSYPPTVITDNISDAKLLFVYVSSAHPETVPPVRAPPSPNPPPVPISNITPMPPSPAAWPHVGYPSTGCAICCVLQHRMMLRTSNSLMQIRKHFLFICLPSYPGKLHVSP